VHVVVDFGLDFGRWSSEAQQGYKDQLLALLGVEKLDTPTMRFAVERLARLAFTEPAEAIGLADESRAPLREIAVRALAWLDGPEAGPALLAALGDDRARWAIYALRRLFAEQSRDVVIEQLKAAPMHKVTVAKEIVRLLGELGGKEGFDALCEIERTPVHRDVRIAMLRAVWDHLERPVAWEILERAVEDPDWVLASRVAEIPLVRLSDFSEQRLTALLGKLLARPEPEARVSILQRATGLPLRDLDRSLFRMILAHLDRGPEEAGQAIHAAMFRMHSDEVPTVLERIDANLSRRPVLVAILPALRLSPHAPAQHREIARGALALLEGDPHLVTLAVELSGHLLGYVELGKMLVRLARADLLHADAMVAATSAIRLCVHKELLENVLAAESDPRLRRLAVAALAEAAGPGKGWSRERRERLECYRGDPSPFVAGAAQLIFPPEVREATSPAAR
jgi:hypothetical protein